MNLPTLPADKANHMVYGAVLASLGGMHSVLAGAALCAVFAIGKEAMDRVRKTGTPDLLDAVATLAGGALVLAPLVAWGAGALS
ncbi:MAG: hypothetical protein ACK4F7_03935 [Inhella sp.]